MLIDHKPIVTKADKGFYSTVIRPDKMVETAYFEDDDSPGKIVGISDIRLIAARHIEDHKQSL